MPDDHQRKSQLTEQFLQQYGTPPTLWTRAPGRVDLMGSHTDYNMGYVVTMTIDRDTWLAAAPREDGKVEIHSMNLPGGGVFNLAEITHDEQWAWTNYVRGVAKALTEAGYALKGFNGLLHSSVPFNSGLSSSAALEMAAALMFSRVGGFALDPVQMALLGQKAENHFVGVSSGILDQYTSALGKAGAVLLLDCRELTSRTVPLAEGLQVVICDTRAERHLVGTEYDDRRAQCEEGVRLLRRYYPEIRALRDLTLAQFEAYEAALPEVVARRCRFIIEENQRVLDLAAALPLGDRDKLRRLFAASYEGAIRLYEIGAPSMAHMLEAMLSAPGVIGGRQAGAGFGGCMVALVEADQVEAFTAHVRRTYRTLTDIEAHVYAVKPSDGAGVL